MSSRPVNRAVPALVLVALIATAATLAALALSGGSEGEASSPSIRLATPEEVEAATGTAPSDAVGAAGSGSNADDSATDDATAPEWDAAQASAAAPTEPLASSGAGHLPVPDVGEEPFVAVAEALSPSVVLVEVGSVSEFGFGLGSGIVWDAENGYIVTNQHVVEGAPSVTIVLSDGVSVEGEIVGGSTDHDVAVVRVDPAGLDLVAAVFAPISSVRVGQLVVAIGSPLGLTGTVTAGIVSAVRIQIQGGADPDSPVPMEMIQTDAAINRGNSGGALADAQGRVIGMNTMIQTTTGGSIGLGFAVPSDTVELIAKRIVRGQPLELGYLGVSGEGVGDGNVGVALTEVIAGSAAERAGLLVGDVIISIDSEPMYNLAELAAAVKLRLPGETVELTIRRGGDIFIVTAVLDAIG